MTQVPIRVEIVRDATRLAALEDPWWALWRRCPAATPFQSPAWLIAWWQHFHPGPLCTIAAWRGGALAGLAPFYVEAETSRLLPVGISVSDYLDVLVDSDEDEVCRALAEAAVGAAGWREWSLEELPPGAAAWRLPSPPGCRAAEHAQSACPVLALSGDGFGNVPARRRAQSRHDRARAERRGAVRIEPACDAPAFLAHLFRMHEARWRELGEPGVLAGRAVQGFHRAALPALMSHGLARCFLLTVGGEPAGAHYGLIAKGHAYYFIGGFEPSFAKESPGALLIGHAIREAAREGAREFHFLRGREDYKYRWGAVDRWNRRRSFSREEP